MKYIRTNFRYQITDVEIFQLLHIRPDFEIDCWYCTCTTDGTLMVKPSFAWDGASFPAINTKNTIRGSCLHDVLAKLMREQLLPSRLWRKADFELNQVLKEDGMSAFRRRYWLKGLKLTNGSYARPRNRRKILTAP